MTVFQHHIYEYRKGLRNLVLYTASSTQRKEIESHLAAKGIDFVIYPLGQRRVNVFFGAPECVNVIRRIGKTSLNDFTPEEDFILGIMLGYARLQQCVRYLRKTGWKPQGGNISGIRENGFPVKKNAGQAFSLTTYENEG